MTSTFTTIASSDAGVSSPAITRRGNAMANPVMWFEVMGKDSAGLQRFYREVFGWKLTPPVK